MADTNLKGLKQKEQEELIDTAMVTNSLDFASTTGISFIASPAN